MSVEINFEYLSANTKVDWSDELLDKYLFKWYYINLGNYESIPWTIELFEKYLNERYLEEDCVKYNKSLVTLDFIEMYKHKFDS